MSGPTALRRISSNEILKISLKGSELHAPGCDCITGFSFPELEEVRQRRDESRAAFKRVSDAFHERVKDAGLDEESGPELKARVDQGKRLKDAIRAFHGTDKSKTELLNQRMLAWKAERFRMDELNKEEGRRRSAILEESKTLEEKAALSDAKSACERCSDEWDQVLRDRRKIFDPDTNTIRLAEPGEIAELDRCCEEDECRECCDQIKHDLETNPFRRREFKAITRGVAKLIGKTEDEVRAAILEEIRPED